MPQLDQDQPTSNGRKHFLALELKDVLQFGILLVSMTVFYFSQVRDTDRRVTIIETKLQNLETNMAELKGDVKSILTAVRGNR
ncbi:hypothetical protein [Leptonema illini]|uniref:Uncharacterized protein n=1 Tax=Leptonema illini DSM 21528 TaxID=929563 RepID=H2CKJ0_9LEPT|nr:hypothetical protein [Leptonema illini]EHQ08295.1 hypothetical protein Lepil_3638 [Leptonema illini DSM 21528]